MSTLKEICKEQTEMIDEMRQNIKELTKESDQYKAERDTLIDDIAVLKANISRLEREKEKLRKVNSNGWKQKDKVINNLHYLYTTLTEHIRLKAEVNPSVDRYINLVNYIDRLERGEDE
ncbi:hypothetical protein QI208_13145 [Staphylococcus saprophyticus]|nr:hypothetical protein [Staphylococcus saprophyticus]